MTQRERRRAAVLLRALAAVEDARIRGDVVRVVSLLDGVDPVEACQIADTLDFDGAVHALARRIVPRPWDSRKVW